MSKERKIDFVAINGKCSRAMALAYLEAEEWNTIDALLSLRGDRRQ